MYVPLIAAILTAIVIIFTIIYRFINSQKFEYFEKQGIPGVKAFRFYYGVWNGIWNGVSEKSLSETDIENIKKFGKVYGMYDGQTPNLIVAEPALIKKVLEDDSDKFQSRRAYRVKGKILRQSLLNLEGKQCKEVQELLNIGFGDGKIGKLFPRIIKSAETFVQEVVLKSLNQEQNFVNISEKVSSYINDTIAFSVFGLDLNTDITVQKKFYDAVNKVFLVDNPDSIYSVIPFYCENVGSLDKFVLRPSAAEYLTGLAGLVIDEKNKNSDIKPEGRAVDFIDLLLSAAKEEKLNAAKEKGVTEENLQSLLTKEQFIGLCIEVILSVGRAAKSSLILSLHTLACHPNIQEKLYNEIVKHLADGGEISYKFIQQFEYLDKFLGEILRVYPIEYRLERKCIEEVIWDQITVKPGVLVSVPLYGVHKLEEFYPDPEKFEPERFNEENSKKRNHFTYLPFGQAGANSFHVGVQLGVLFIKMAIISLLSEVKFSKSEETKEPPEFVSGVTGVPIPKPVIIKIEKRE